MKITKSRLKQIIKEEVQRLDEIPKWRRVDAERRGVTHPGSSPPPPGHPSRSGKPSEDFSDDYHGEGEEHDRGFIDGYFREPRADNATVDYDIGYERGGIQSDSDEERGLDRDPEGILYP